MDESKNYLTNKEIKRKMNAMNEARRLCDCGHTVYIMQVGRCLCSNCGHYVYRNEKDKFKYKLLEELGEQNGQKLCNKEIDRIVA